MKLLAFLAVSFTAVGLQGQNVEYYRRISTDDRQYTYVPHEKIDSALARKTSCYKVAFDEHNRIKYIRYEIQGRQAVDRKKISFIHFSYSDSVEIRFLNYPNDSGKTHYEHLILNKDKAPTAVVFYDNNGKLMKDNEGVTRYERTLNSNGWMIECHFYDEHGKRIENNNGDYYFRYDWKNDSVFYRPELSYYDRRDSLHDGKRGYALVKMAFYKTGERLSYENRHFNAQLQPTLCSGGYAVYRRAYYDNGLLKTETFFDQNNKPVDNKSGFARIVYKYNNYGNVTTFDCYKKGIDNHYLEHKIEYDKNQRIVKKTKEWKFK